MYEAYNQGFDILTSTDITTILTQHKRITEEELKEASIIDVIVKGSGNTHCGVMVYALSWFSLFWAFLQNQIPLIQ